MNGSLAGREHRVLGHIDLLFSTSFALKRLTVACIAWMVPFSLCLAARQGILGLFAVLPGLWPYRSQFLAEARGLRVSWWFLKEWLSWDEIESAEVIVDRGAFVLGKRKPILRLRRRARRPVTIRADELALERLAREIREELATQTSQGPDRK